MGRGVSEFGLEIEVCSVLLPRVDASCHVESEQPIQKRHACADAAHRAANRADLTPIPDPSEISKHSRPNARVARSDLGPRQPERVSALRGVWRLAANRLRSAEVPTPLRWQTTHGPATGERQRTSKSPKAVRCRDVERTQTA